MSNKIITSVNPTNYEAVGKVDVSDEKEIIEKVENANKARKVWKDLGLQNRIKHLKQLVTLFNKRKNDLIRLITNQMGMPITQSKFDIKSGLEFFNWYLNNAAKYLSPEIIYKDNKIVQTVYYEPIGVAAVITPWNFPFGNFVWGVGQNLISGNTVVYKASEECPLFGKLLEEIIKESGLPDGVFSEVYGYGEVGDFLARQNINLISFTGSTKVGKYLYKLGGEKFIKVVCEMGGSAPGIVFHDADLNASIESIYSNRFINCGQMCDALKRLIVEEKIYDQVVERLKNKLQSVKVGDPTSENTDIGPLVAKRQLELLESQVKDAIEKGAKVICGGKRPDKMDGAFYEPTLLTNIKSDMRVWQEEVFGPVLPVRSFKTQEEAIEMANDTKYGLGSYVYTNNSQKALEVASQIDSGMVSINAANYVSACSPFGGYKDSGIGREHGKFGFADLTQVKVVATKVR